MKSFAVALVVALGTTFAATFPTASASAMTEGKYDCTIYPKGGSYTPVQLQFEYKNKDITCVEDIDNGESCVRWFTVNPDTALFWLDGLYDGGFGFTDAGDFEVSADADGCNLGHLTLYANSGFTKGFITSGFRCSFETNVYTAGEVYCTVR